MTSSASTARARDQNPHGAGRYIPILDGWRAIAIILVLLFHGTYNTAVTGSAIFTRIAEIAGRTGALGVLIFFCISGYLITQRLLVESRRTGMFSVKAFYVKRAFRILPPLAVYLLVIFGLHLLGFLALQRRDLSAPLFMANYFQGTWYTSHFWSLSVEEHFYIFWPLCVLLAGWRRSLWIGILLVAAVAVWRPWVVMHTPNHSALASKLQHTDMRMDYIMMGAIVALLVEFYPVTLSWLERLGGLWGLLILFVLLLITTRPSPIDLRSVQAVLLTLIVCASTVANAPVTRYLLTNRFILFIGKVSYSLYIWQQLFLGHSQNHFWSSPSALPVKYGVALLAAYMSYRFVERPFIRKARALLEASPSPQAQG